MTPFVYAPLECLLLRPLSVPFCMSVSAKFFIISFRCASYVWRKHVNTSPDPIVKRQGCRESDPPPTHHVLTHREEHPTQVSRAREHAREDISAISYLLRQHEEEGVLQKRGHLISAGVGQRLGERRERGAGEHEVWGGVWCVFEREGVGERGLT